MAFDPTKCVICLTMGVPSTQIWAIPVRRTCMFEFDFGCIGQFVPARQLTRSLAAHLSPCSGFPFGKETQTRTRIKIGASKATVSINSHRFQNLLQKAFHAIILLRKIFPDFGPRSSLYSSLGGITLHLHPPLSPAPRGPQNPGTYVVR